jgi:ABC-type lipoprotein export system ATPase subunit
MTVNKIPYTVGDTILKTENVSLVLGGTPKEIERFLATGQNNEAGRIRTILRDINVSIQDWTVPGRTTGQIVGLMGPSGKGKTQLLNCWLELTNQPGEKFSLVMLKRTKLKK